jgi:hypothetical protein
MKLFTREGEPTRGLRESQPEVVASPKAKPKRRASKSRDTKKKD